VSPAQDEDDDHDDDGDKMDKQNDDDDDDDHVIYVNDDKGTKNKNGHRFHFKIFQATKPIITMATSLSHHHHYHHHRQNNHMHDMTRVYRRHAARTRERKIQTTTVPSPPHNNNNSNNHNDNDNHCWNVPLFACNNNVYCDHRRQSSNTLLSSASTIQQSHLIPLVSPLQDMNGSRDCCCLHCGMCILPIHETKMHHHKRHQYHDDRAKAFEDHENYEDNGNCGCGFIPLHNGHGCTRHRPSPSVENATTRQFL
jgi:hypothetical protein